MSDCFSRLRHGERESFDDLCCTVGRQYPDSGEEECSVRFQYIPICFILCDLWTYVIDILLCICHDMSWYVMIYMSVTACDCQGSAKIAKDLDWACASLKCLELLGISWDQCDSIPSLPFGAGVPRPMKLFGWGRQTTWSTLLYQLDAIDISRY